MYRWDSDEFQPSSNLYYSEVIDKVKKISCYIHGSILSNEIRIRLHQNSYEEFDGYLNAFKMFDQAIRAFLIKRKSNIPMWSQVLDLFTSNIRRNKGYIPDTIDESIYEDRLISKEVIDCVCPICQCIMREPHVISCGHMFCSPCIKAAFEGMSAIGLDSTCPKCRNIVSENTYRTIELRNYVNSMKVNCSRAGSGCNWVGTIEEFDRHQNECSYVTCKCCSCNETVTVTNKSEHDAICPYRSVKCDQCGVQGAYLWLEKHGTDTCYKRKITCEKCHESHDISSSDIHNWIECKLRSVICVQCVKYIDEKSMRTHWTDDCENTMIKCNKCDCKYVRKDMRLHTRQQCKLMRRGGKRMKRITGDQSAHSDVASVDNDVAPIETMIREYDRINRAKIRNEQNRDKRIMKRPEKRSRYPNMKKVFHNGNHRHR